MKLTAENSKGEKMKYRLARPILTKVSAPQRYSSSIAMDADGPPIPVDVTLTFTPSSVPV